MVKEKKLNKEQVDRIINRIREEQKKREKFYRQPLIKQEERTEKVYEGVSKKVQESRNKQKQIRERINKIDLEQKNIIKNRIESMQKGTYFPTQAYNKQRDISKQEKLKLQKELKGMESAQKNLREQYKKEKREKIKYQALKYGSRIATGVNVTAERLVQGISGLAKKKITSKPILKKSRLVVNIPDYKAPSILGDPNRFFKDEYEQDRRNLFFK